MSTVKMKIWNCAREYFQELSPSLITAVFFFGYLSYYLIFVAKVRDSALKTREILWSRKWMHMHMTVNLMTCSSFPRPAPPLGIALSYDVPDINGCTRFGPVDYQKPRSGVGRLFFSLCPPASWCSFVRKLIFQATKMLKYTDYVSILSIK